MDRIAVYRIIGNALPPRDSAETRLEALEDILKAERECDYQPYYVLNQLHDSTYREAVTDLLKRYNLIWRELLFNPAVFRAQSPENRLLYAININVARNKCLKHAFFKNTHSFALILDQDCYFHPEEWEAALRVIQKDQINTPTRNYYSFPSVRTHTVMTELSHGAGEEPMLMFRHNAPRWFNPLIPFGKSEKLELCEWLGHRWQNWKVKADSRTKIAGRIRHLSYGDIAADDWKVRINLREQSLKVLMKQLEEKYL